MGDMPHTLCVRVRIGHSRTSQGRPAGLLPCHVLHWGHLLHNGWPHRCVALARRWGYPPRHRRKDRFVEASRGAAHHVLPRGVAIVGGDGFDAAHAGVPVVDVAAMRMAVVPILKTLHWRRGTSVGGWRRRRRGCRSIAANAGSVAAAALLARVRIWREMLLQLLHTHAVLLHRLHLTLQRRDCRRLRFY